MLGIIWWVLNSPGHLRIMNILLVSTISESLPGCIQVWLFMNFYKLSRNLFNLKVQIFHFLQKTLYSLLLQLFCYPLLHIFYVFWISLCLISDLYFQNPFFCIFFLWILRGSLRLPLPWYLRHLLFSLIIIRTNYCQNCLLWQSTYKRFLVSFFC